MGVKLPCKRADNAGAQAGFRLGEDIVRLSYPIVGDHKPPVLTKNVIGDTIINASAELSLKACFNELRTYTCIHVGISTDLLL